MTNGNGGPQTPASGVPHSGGVIPSQVGALAVGHGPAGGMFSPAAGQANNLPISMPQTSQGDEPSSAGRSTSVSSPTTRKGSLLSISNWRLRTRLTAVIVVPTITALALGGFQIANSFNNAQSFKRVQELATLNALVVTASGDLADERDAAAGFVAAGGQAGAAMPSAAVPLKTTFESDISKTTAVTRQIVALANQDAGAGFQAQTENDLTNGVVGEISDLTAVRQEVTSTKASAQSVISAYENVISQFTKFSNDVAAGTGNATLQSNVSVLNALLRMEDDASQQRALLYQALESTPAVFTPNTLSELNQASEQQKADGSAFTQTASVAQSQLEQNTVSGPLVDVAASLEELAVSDASTNINQPLNLGQSQGCTTGLTQAACWNQAQTAEIKDMRDVSNGIVGDISSQSNSLESTALRNALEISIATLLLLIVVLVITFYVARSMIRPLRRLRSEALEVAGSRLPEMVRRLSESEGGDTSAEIEPIGVTSTDEIGEVARAFDQVHREAVRLAADEALLRGNLNAMFVNLSRRSQSLIERQLTLIDDLEQTEQDSDRLSSLFRLDHLATRMRRNSENLLVLAGHEAASRRWSQPVPLVDVLRAAISEIEQYERVVLNVQPGIQVIGQAVNDVVHTVAEIVENATTFSPEDTQVFVTGQPLTSGGVLLDITDSGVGISEEEMAHANWRLDNPPVVDVAVSRRMGLFVVGRLAARHGVRVRLRHAQSGGLTALIWLPESVAASESGASIDRLRKFDTDDFGPAPSLPTPSFTEAAATSAPPNIPAVTGNASASGNGFTGAAATASRIPRLGGGGPSSKGSGNGSFPAFGGVTNGVATNGGAPVPTAPTAPAVPQDSAKGGNTLDAPGGSLPVRSPGQHPLGPTAPAGGPSMFGGDTASDDFATSRMPAIGGDGGAAGTGPIPVISPVSTGNGAGGSDGGTVTVPAATGAVHHRLPIFDSLESDWFRRSGTDSSTSGDTSADVAAAPAGQTWNSPADAGWRAARVVAAPESSENTMAGLPKRTPRANLVPGSIGGGTKEEPNMEDAVPIRSADSIRSRMSSFQRGVREARAVGAQDEEP
jgi:signal transduction histidine kinase